MFLAIDVGNTHTTLGLFDTEGAICECWRLQTDATATSDELAMALLDLLSGRSVSLEAVDKIGLSCVVPALLRAWQVCFGKLELEVCLINQIRPLPVPVPTGQENTVGADRLANSYAAIQQVGAPVMVIDFGTATNIDVVDASGTFVGGAIAPGVLLSAGALFDKAALLAGVPIEMPSSVIGNTTQTCIQSGVVIGNAAMAEGLIARIREALHAPDCPVIATGGLARTIAQATDRFDYVDPNLTLRGIYLICRDN